MPNFAEMDGTITLAAQTTDDGGPVILVNTFTVPPKDADRVLGSGPINRLARREVA